MDHIFFLASWYGLIQACRLVVLKYNKWATNLDNQFNTPYGFRSQSHVIELLSTSESGVVDIETHMEY
jgi:hypothetical protein